MEEVAEGRVTFTETTATRDGRALRVDRSTLRFLDVTEIDALLAETGFTTVERYGDWGRGPLTDTSRNIVTVARAV